MFVKPISLFNPNYVDNSAVETLYTVDTGQQIIVQRLTFTNVGSGGNTVSVWLVPSGGSADNTNLIADAISIPEGDTWICSQAERQVLEAGDTIQAQASAASSITAHGSGVRVA